MSPLRLRRQRAERLLRDEFQRLRGAVLASVRPRLRASGVSLDGSDLEACYAQAWQGLYAAMLEGREIADPAAWLGLVTFRRAVDEHRARVRARCGAELSRRGPSGRPEGGAEAADGGGLEAVAASGAHRDIASELDDRRRLRALFEGLRGRLDAREREAATLCYLQGLSRAQAAARLGVSEARMRKLMEGRGPGRPGVAGKVGALVGSIRDERWCEEQGSLMRALAYGILDPQGERYRLALAHHGDCPACRAYVASLRGLAATLPPVFLPYGLLAGVLARVAQCAHAGAVAAGPGGAPSPGGATTGGPAGGLGGAPPAGAQAGGGAGAGAQAGQGLGGGMAASGAAGVVGAGGAGGWLVGAGGLGAKLAAGCLLALGVGAGCVALGGAGSVPGGHARHDRSTREHGAPAATRSSATAYALRASLPPTTAAPPSTAVGAQASTPAAKASREFGPEQALSTGAGPAATPSDARNGPSARAASSAGESNGAAATGSGASGGEGSVPSVAAPAGAGGALATGSSSGGAPSRAEREFSPG